jgi:hypothetical protein
MAKRRLPETRKETPEATVLARRLDDGWNRIEQAEARGEDTQTWETFWIKLLHEYEAACILPEAAP